MEFKSLNHKVEHILSGLDYASLYGIHAQDVALSLIDKWELPIRLLPMLAYKIEEVFKEIETSLV